MMTEGEYADNFDHGSSSTGIGRKEEKKQTRKEKKQRKKDEKHAKNELWRLVVSSVAPGYRAAILWAGSHTNMIFPESGCP